MKSYVLDARTAQPHFPGIGRYVANLAHSLPPLLAAGERLVLLADPAHPVALPEGAAQAVPAPASPFSLSQQWQIPRLLRLARDGGGRVLYHSPYTLMPLRPAVPAVLTVYDLIPLRYPGHSTARARLFYRWATRLALRAARQVIAISEFTRQDFLTEFGRGRGAPAITAIPLAAGPAFGPQGAAAIAAVRSRCALPGRYALYLGSNKPHKNLVRLVEAWAQVRTSGDAAGADLVIAGAWDARYPEARRRAAELGLGDGVRWLGPVPEPDLPALYAGAAAFVFPSLYEGFGLPVLEAMACGAPVACAAASSLPEVAGDAALLFDPRDVPALAAALSRLLGDPDLRAELSARGLRQAARFSWTETARRTLAVYRAVLEG